MQLHSTILLGIVVHSDRWVNWFYKDKKYACNAAVYIESHKVVFFFNSLTLSYKYAGTLNWMIEKKRTLTKTVELNDMINLINYYILC